MVLVIGGGVGAVFVLLFLLVSKCLTFPFPPPQRGSDELSMYNSPTSGMSSISGEFVPTTVKFKLPTNICLGQTDRQH